MRVLIIASLAESLVRFRGQLLKDLIEAGCTVIACAPNDDPETRDQLKAMQVEFKTFYLDRAGLNLLKDLRSLQELRRLIKSVQPDIVLSYTSKMVIYGSWAARLAGVPHIYSMITGLGYAFGNNSLKQKVVSLLVKQLYKQNLGINKAVFFQNPDDLKLFVDQHLVLNEKAVLINGSGVELDKFSMSPPQMNNLSFLLIARLIKEKGILEYVEAARILKQKYPHVQFRLVGPYDPNPTAIHADEINDWQAEGIIDYPGETNDVRPYLAATSVYVLPSFYREGTPRSILEAMSMGRPIITTDAPGCRETVIDGENGFLIPVKDTRALVSTMERFILEPNLIPVMGKRSRELAEQKYDVRKVNATILKTMRIPYPHDIEQQ